VKNRPFVSIVIPTFNRKDRLGRCLLHLGQLEYPRDRFEVIVVDDGSHDAAGIAGVVGAFQGSRLIRNNKNEGAAAAKNRGAKESSGAFVVFIDDDIEADKGWLSELVAAALADDTAAICASKLLFKDRPGIVNSTGGVMNIYGDAWDRGVFEEDTGQYDKEERIFFGCSAAILVRRDALERVGYFDETLLSIYEDVDLGWRINLAGYKAIYVPGSVAYHAFGGTIRSDDPEAKYMLERNRIRIMLKNYELFTLLRNLAGLLKFKFERFKRDPRSAECRRGGLLFASLKAWSWNIACVSGVLTERVHVRKFKKVRDRDIFKIMGRYKYESFGI